VLINYVMCWSVCYLMVHKKKGLDEKIMKIKN